MRLDEPAWWYGPEGERVARLLTPVAWAWGFVGEQRWKQARAYVSQRPVICIGNFTAGGTGKTPMALHMASVVEGLLRSPVFLTRGYGGRLAGPHRIVTGDKPRDVGDEPLLLAARAPVVLARDREQGARAIEAGGRPGDVIIMDDGLQNPSLAKDLSIAVVDGRRGIGNGYVMPAGPLRAPLQAQLARVDAIVINTPVGGDAVAGRDGTMVTDWVRRKFDGPILTSTTAPAGDTTWLEEGPIVAFAAIGAPERFFNLLRASGARLAATRSFPDHHFFAEADAAALLALAGQHKARLLTTEKDWVRLDEAGIHAGELRARSQTLKIALSFADADQNRLVDLVASALAEQGRARISKSP